MTLALLAALLLQAAPRIEGVDSLAGEIQRPLLWHPLVVTLSSAAGFRGDLVARSSFGFSFAREVVVAAGGRERVILPAIDPDEVSAGGARARLPQDFPAAELLVGVDARLPYAADLASTPGTRFRRIEPGDLKELLSMGLLEAFDALLLSDAAGLPLEAYATAGAWAVVPSREEADEFVAGLRAGSPPIPAVTGTLWALAPAGGWMPARKTSTLFFATVYALAAFLALAVAARFRPTLAPAAVGIAALLSVAAYFLFFPRGRLWVVEDSCEVAGRGGGAAEWRVWFAGSGTALDTRIEFPRLVKPVFPRMGGADEPFTIRVQGRGCVVEGLHLAAGGAACFAGAEDRASSMRAVPSLTAPLHQAFVKTGGRTKSLGDLPAGAAVPAEAGEGGEPPRDRRFSSLGFRFTAADCVFGWMDPEERPARDVRSPDLADARERPRFFVQRLK